MLHFELLCGLKALKNLGPASGLSKLDHGPIISRKCLVKINGCKHPVMLKHTETLMEITLHQWRWITTRSTMIYFLLSNRSSHMNSVQRKTYHVFARLLKILWYNWVLCHPQKSPSPTRVNFQLSPATLPRHDWHALSIGPSLSLLSNGLSKKHTLQLIYRWFLNIEPARQIIFWVNRPYIFIE